MAALPRWVAWQTEGRGTEGKPTKVPYAPDGRRARADASGTWGTREAAEARAGQLPRPFGAGGVGLELGDHAGRAIGGIDLDTCRGETGDLAPWAAEVVQRFASYAEVSPSSTGVKVFFLFDAADLPALRAIMGTEHGKQFKRKGDGDHPPAIELYLGNRYFAVTDQPLNGSQTGLRKVDAGTLEWLLTEAGPAFAADGAAGQKSSRTSTGTDRSRSAAAFKMAADVKRAGGAYPDFLNALDGEPQTAAWKAEKGGVDGERELRRAWDRAGKLKAANDEVELTEDGAALAFEAKHRDGLRYCHDAGAWYAWSGTHWRPDGTGLAFTWARDLVREMNRGADLAGRAITGRAAFAGAVERYSRAARAFAVRADAWDSDPFLLATPGGTVDLRRGALRPARPGDMMTRTTAVSPSTAAPPDRWLAFLNQATGKDDELIGFLQRWCGYCLTGDTREHALLFGYGPGGNGKSVFLNTVSRIMGDYAAVAAMDTFTASQGDKHPTDLAMLRGARLVCATETEEGRAWAESRIKQMTGGDPVSARFMRQDFFTYRPQFKLTIIGNHKPVLRNVDEAARRRFNIVPFTRKPDVPDRELEAKLEAEWPAILAWMIKGCLAWQRDGLTKPTAVAEATADYFDAQDVFGQWAEERCIRDPSLAERPGKLLADFNAWAGRNGEQEANRSRFRGWAERHGSLRYKTVKGSDYLQGIGLRPIEGAQGAQGWAR